MPESFFPSHPCEMRSLSVILHSPPPAFYLFSVSIRKKHFDRVKLRLTYEGVCVRVYVCVGGVEGSGGIK